MTSFALKVIGIITMFIDHLGFMFFPSQISFRLIGRLAFPIFAFQLSEGYFHSKNKEKHIFRMIIFSILSQIPFSLFLLLGTNTQNNTLNIGFTLTLGLLCMYAFDKIKNPFLKISTILLILFLTNFISVDYGVFGVLLCFLFYVFRKNKYFKIVAPSTLVICKMFIESSLFKLPMLYALIPICLYNGQKGLDIKFTKYLFYVFYPTHLFIFSIIYLIA